MGIPEKIKAIQDEIGRTQLNKATEHHVGLLKAKIAKLKREQEAVQIKKSSKKSDGFDVKRSGDATIVIIGFPSVGKSTLLNALTGSKSSVGAFQFTTVTVVPGILDYRGAKIQMLDLPGIIKGASSGKGLGKRILSVARSADIVLLVLDVFQPYHEDVLVNELSNIGIRLNQQPPNIVIEKSSTGGIAIAQQVKLKKMSLLKGKKGLIMGVANDRSIAWGIAKKLSEHGAELAFTYLGETLKKRVVPLAQSLKSNFTLSCDVEKKEDVVRTFNDIKNKWRNLDFVVHAIAFSDRSELSGEYINTSRENFLKSMLISCFSLTEVAKEASKIMSKGSSMLTLTYESSKVIPNYNVMGVCKAALESSVKYLARDVGSKGIRVNAISAGPIKTLAASAIGDAKFLYKWNEDHSLLKRNVDINDIGGSALYLLSNLAAAVTGEIHYVDAGYNKVGMPNPKNIT